MTSMTPAQLADEVEKSLAQSLCRSCSELQSEHCQEPIGHDPACRLWHHRIKSLVVQYPADLAASLLEVLRGGVFTADDRSRRLSQAWFENCCSDQSCEDFRFAAAMAVIQGGKEDHKEFAAQVSPPLPAHRGTPNS